MRNIATIGIFALILSLAPLGAPASVVQAAQRDCSVDLRVTLTLGPEDTWVRDRISFDDACNPVHSVQRGPVGRGTSRFARHDPWCDAYNKLLDPPGWFVESEVSTTEHWDYDGSLVTAFGPINYGETHGVLWGLVDKAFTPYSYSVPSSSITMGRWAAKWQADGGAWQHIQAITPTVYGTGGCTATMELTGVTPGNSYPEFTINVHP